MFDINSLKENFFLMLLSKITNFKHRINTISPFYFIIFYLIFHFTIIFLYTKQAEWNLSLLIHINEKFIQFNIETKFPSMVVLKKEGYDGQFFYFLSRYLYDSEIESITVDSSFFRLLRIGVSVLYGFLPFWFGWKYYAILGILLNIVIFFISFWLFYQMVDKNHKYMAFLYLFNPFSLVSNMLLIGDNFFISFFIIFWFFYIKFTSESNPIKQKLYFGLSILVSIVLVSLKEAANFYFIPLFLYSLLHKKKKESFLFLLPILVSLLWIYVINFFKIHEVSTITHLERIRIPFVDMFNFYSSLIQNINSFIDIFKSIPYFLLLFILISLALEFLNFIRLYKNFSDLFSIKVFELLFYFPIAIVVFSIVVVDYEYWLAFDNIFRILAFAYLWNLYFLLIPKFKHFSNYYLFLSIFLITILLVPRYNFKKIGEFIVL